MSIATGPPTEYIIRIHGTGASRPEDVGDAWWQGGNEFHEVLGARLAGRARFFPTSFRWSGKNSERERRTAGIVLLEDWLIPLEARQQPYHLIGHSHGGSVIWAALMEAERRRQPLENLRSWTTVGTPFLHYRPDPVQGWLGLICLAYIALLVLGQLLITALPGSNSLLSWWEASTPVQPLKIGLSITVDLAELACLPLGLSYLLKLLGHRTHRARARKTFEGYGGRWLGIYSPHDEAIQGLRASRSLGGEVLMRVPTLTSAVREMIRTRRSRSPRRSSEDPRGSEDAGFHLARQFRALFSATGHRPRLGDLRLPVYATVWACLSLSFASSLTDNLAGGSVDPAFPTSGTSGAPSTVDPLTQGPGVVSYKIIANLDANSPNFLFITLELFLLLGAVSCGFASLGYALRSIGALASLFDRRTARRGDDSDPRTWVESGRSTQSPLILTRLTFTRIALFPFREVYGWAHNALIAPIVDRFVWTRIRHKAQGNDLGGWLLFDVAESPLPMESGVPIARELDSQIVARADEYASRAISKIRLKLGSLVLFGAAGGKAEGAGGDQELVTWKELIHNTYFDHDPIRERIASRILGDPESMVLGAPGPRRESRTPWEVGNALRLFALMWLVVCLPFLAWTIVYLLIKP